MRGRHRPRQYLELVAQAGFGFRRPAGRDVVTRQVVEREGLQILVGAAFAKQACQALDEPGFELVGLPLAHQPHDQVLGHERLEAGRHRRRRLRGGQRARYVARRLVDPGQGPHRAEVVVAGRLDGPCRQGHGLGRLPQIGRLHVDEEVGVVVEQ